MNHTYKHIWSKTLGRLVIVPECCKGGQGRKGGKATLGAAAMVAATMLAGPALAQSVLPTGGTVVSGAASIATNGAAMTINQSSDKLIANWQSFSIGAGNSVTFNQPGASSVALNRVTGQDASQILGSLTANGQVFLVNPNGIAIGKTGSVQTGAFVASTLGISDANFLAGNYRFTGTSGTVTNEGNVSGKTVALISPVISNSGTITGNTALAAGTDVQLDFNGDGLLSVEVKASTMATLVENKGLIKADGGVAILTAKGASAAMKGVVNNTGTIEANSIGTKNGRILLLGDMQHGEVKAAGKLKAKFVETSAAKVTIDKDLKVETQGGKWLIDPTDIVVDSSNVDAYVNALSSGTSIEIATPSAGSQPGDIAINAAMSWSSSSVLTLTANNNIAINAAISAASGGLTINAGGTITAPAAISLGTFVLNSGSWQQTAATLPSFYAKDFQLNGGSFLRVTGGDGTGATPYLLADIYGLQGIGSSTAFLSQSWKLANDIDASGTAIWNNGAGFNPIGIVTDRFVGALDGGGHVISGLTANQAPQQKSGLFAFIGAGGAVKDLGLVDATVTGPIAGTLAGESLGTISHVFATGTVTGDNSVSTGHIGGLIGDNYGSIDSSSFVGTVTSGGNNAGGLVGYARSTGSISNSYASANTDGLNSVGGLVGLNEGSISNTYATGTVRAFVYAGGLVGYNSSGTITSSYATGAVSSSNYAGGLVGVNNAAVSSSFWDKETTGLSSSVGLAFRQASAVGLTTAQARSAASYTGWDFTNVWYQTSDMRPILRAEAATADSNGVITISNLHQLALMGANLSGNYKLAVNLDASATKGLNASDIWSTSGWVPVGTYVEGDLSKTFTGTFDGQNHTISNLFINRPTENYIGLFGITTRASISNIGLVGGAVKGSRNIGGLIGYMRSGTVSNAYNTGDVFFDSAGRIAGGLIGGSIGSWDLDLAAITNVYATGNVVSFGTETTGLWVGGLIGHASVYTVLTNAYATGDVIAPTSNYVGGLVGWMLARISDVYATGNVTGAANVGGLIGMMGNPNGVASGAKIVTNAYATGTVTGTSNVGGLIGYAGMDTVINNSFWNVTTTGQSSGCGGMHSSATCSTTGLTTAQMADPFKYIDAGWNFSSTWASLKTGGAPVLRSLTTAPVYTYYVRLTGDSTTTYGDTIDTSAIAVDGVGAGNVGVSWGSAIGATTNAGTYGYGGSNVVSLSYATGAAGDYYVDYSGRLTIDKRVVSLDGTRTYDGTTNVGAGALTIGNLVNGETLTLTGIGQLAGKNVGTGLGLSSLGTLALGNGSGLASNYTLSGGTTTVDIAKAVLTLSGFTTANKVYDGTTAASILSLGTLLGAIGGDSVSFAATPATFADKNAGAGKTVTLNGVLAGADAGNYTLASGTVTTTADISRAVITAISGITALSKPYDGNTTAALVYSGAVFNGMVAGDLLSVASGTGAFADSNSGTGKLVNITGLSLGGLDARNYTLASTTATTTADINASVAPPLPPPNTIDTGTAAINSIGSTTRASFVVTTQDAFAQPVLIDVAPPVNVASDTRSETRKRWDDDQ